MVLTSTVREARSMTVFNTAKTGCCRVNKIGDKAIHIDHVTYRVTVSTSPAAKAHCVLGYHLDNFGSYRAYKSEDKVINFAHLTYFPC